jgi:hypothetical protein
MAKNGPSPARPLPGEYADFHAGYVGLVPETDVVKVMDKQRNELLKLIKSIPEKRSTYRYEPGKWSIADVVGHVVDSERVFAFRALFIARGNTSPLPGFDQDEFVAAAQAERFSIRELIEPFSELRKANVTLFRQLPPEAWSRKSTASGTPVSVRGLAYILVGHVRHHMKVLNERYLA